MGVADGNIEVLPLLNGGLDKLDGIPGAKTPDGKRTDSGCFDPAPSSSLSKSLASIPFPVSPLRSSRLRRRRTH